MFCIIFHYCKVFFITCHGVVILIFVFPLYIRYRLKCTKVIVIQGSFIFFIMPTSIFFFFFLNIALYDCYWMFDFVYTFTFIPLIFFFNLFFFFLDQILPANESYSFRANVYFSFLRKLWKKTLFFRQRAECLCVVDIIITIILLTHAYLRG